MSKAQEQVALAAEGLDIAALISKSIKGAEKAAALSPVMLRRESFAGTATSTGSLCIDYKMGGGIPPARIVGIAGPEGTGKSILVTNILNEQGKAQRVGVYFDAEGSTDPLFLAARGINFENYRGRRNRAGELLPKQKDFFPLYQPRTGEEVMGFMDVLLKALPENRNPTDASVIFVIDSVIALISDLLAEDVENGGMAMHGRMYSKILPVINSLLTRAGASLIYTNQIRLRPGQAFGNPEYEPGGEALKFFSSIRLRLKRTQPKLDDDKHPFIEEAYNPQVKPKAEGVWIEPHYDDDGRITGEDRYVYTAVTTEKNKTYTPFQTTWMRIQFDENGSTGHGLDTVYDVFTFFYELKYIRYAVKTGDEKASDVKGCFDVVADEHYDPVKDLGIPKRFTYPEFKVWVRKQVGLVDKLRERLLVSGIAFRD